MSDLILESQAKSALALAKQFPNREDIIQASATVIRSYKAQQESAGLSMFPEQDRMREEQFSKLREFYTDPNHGMDEETLATMNENLRGVEDEKYRLFNEKYFEFHGVPKDQIESNIDQLINEYGLQEYKKPIASHKELFDSIKSDFNTQDQVSAMAGEFAVNNVGTLMAESQFLERMEGVPGYAGREEKWKEELFNRKFSIDSRLDPHRATIKLLSSALMTKESVGVEATTMEQVMADRQEVINAPSYEELSQLVMGVPAEDRKLVISAAIAASANDEAGRKSVLKGLLESFDRGIEGMAADIKGVGNRSLSIAMQRDIASGVEVPVGKEASPEEYLEAVRLRVLGGDAYELQAGVMGVIAGKQFAAPSEEVKQQALKLAENEFQVGELADQLRSAAQNEIDPISSEFIAVRGLYSAAQSVPYLVTSLARGGFAINAMSLAGDSYRSLREQNPTMTAEQAQTVSMISGPAEAFVQGISGKLLTGRLTSFNRFFNQVIGTKGSIPARYLTRTAAITGAEMFQENVQQLTPFMVQGVLSAVSEDMPNVPVELLYKDMVAQQPEMFFAILPLAVMGGGAGTYSDFRNGRALLSSYDELTAQGLSEAASADIRALAAKGDYDGAQSRLREEFKTLGKDQVAVQEARAKAFPKLLAEYKAQQAALDSGIELDILPAILQQRDGKVALRYTNGQEVQYDSRAEAMERFDAIASTEVLNLHRDMITAAKMTTSQLQQGLEFKLIISPLDLTTAELEDQGVASAEQLQKRKEIEDVDKGITPKAEEAKARALTGISANSSAARKAASYVLGSSVNAPAAPDSFGDRVTRITARVYKRGTPYTVIEEFAEGDIKFMLAEGIVERPWIISALRQWESQKGDALFRKSITDDSQVENQDIVEAYSKMVVSYFAGRATAGDQGRIFSKDTRNLIAKALRMDMNAVLTGYASLFEAVYRRAGMIEKARKEGTLPADLESFLAKSAGMSPRKVFEREVVKEGEGIARELQESGTTLSVMTPAQVTPQGRRHADLEEKFNAGTITAEETAEAQRLVDEKAGIDPLLWDAPSQDITSADTSINDKKTAATFTKIQFAPGTVNGDIGGGRFDNATELLKARGVRNIIFDPFNRAYGHNIWAASVISDGKADTTTVNNVLNVIQEPANRDKVIRQAANAVKPTGTSYFLIYEGNGSGVGRQTSKGWQENRKTKDFITEVRAHYGTVIVKNGIIEATNPIKSRYLSTPYYRADIPIGLGTDPAISEVEKVGANKGKLTGLLREDVRKEDLTWPNVINRKPIYLTSDAETAYYFASSVGYNNDIRKFYVSAKNTASPNDLNRVFSQANERGLRDERGDAFFDRKTSVSYLTPREVELLTEAGFDSAKGVVDGRSGIEIAVFNPNQIKSADPFTGVPLDQRFDPARDEITFSTITPAVDPRYSDINLFREYWNSKGVRNMTDVSYSGTQYEHIRPREIEVKKQDRGKGLGTAFMEDLIRFADLNGMQVRLNPSAELGATSRTRLDKFYKRFGFVENKPGKNKDYTISERFYRNPVPKTSTSFSTITPAVDAEYLALAADPEKNQARLQEMVDGAARMAGLKVLYHGTTKEDASKIKASGFLRAAREPAVYLTTDPNGGSYGDGEIGYGDGTVLRLAVDESAIEIDDEFPDGREDYRAEIGYKGRLQIKSADPVTYDENGNIIPLSQRFNPARDEISFSTVTPGVEAFSILTSKSGMRLPKGVTARASEALPIWNLPKLEGKSLGKNLDNPKNREKVFSAIDGALDWLKSDPSKLATSSGWVNFLRKSGVHGDVMMPPSGIMELFQDPAGYVKKLNGGYHGSLTIQGTQSSAKSGLDSTVEMRKLIGIGNAPHPWVVALHHMWGILSRMLPPIQQEGMWLRLITSSDVLNAIQSSIDGNFKLELSQWEAIVQNARATTTGAGNVGNGATANANSFYLMLRNLNGRWSDLANAYAAPNAAEMGRRFWSLDAGAIGIKNKVQRFIGLTFGVPGVIMDRWKFVEFWLPTAIQGTGAKSASDYFAYNQTTPEDPMGIYGTYGGIDSGNPALSLAMYEGMEFALQAAIDNSPELQSALGPHANPGGLHWHGWNAIKNEAVGHSSLDFTADLLRNFGSDINAQSVYNQTLKGTYYTEGALTGTENGKVILDHGKISLERVRVSGGLQQRRPGILGRRTSAATSTSGSEATRGKREIGREPETGTTLSTITAIGDIDSKFAAMFSPFQRSPELRAKLGLAMREKALAVQQKIEPISREFKSRIAKAELEQEEILSKQRSKAQLDREEAAREGVEYGRLLEEYFNADTEEKQAALPATDRTAARSEAKRLASRWRAEQDREQARLKTQEAEARGRLAESQISDTAKSRLQKELERRDSLIGFLRTLDAIQRALPVEVRGKIGGFVALAELSTPAAMLEEIERRVQKIDVELERYLKKEATSQVKKFFKSVNNSKNTKAGEVAKGNNNLPQIYTVMDLAEKAFRSMSAEEGQAEGLKLQGLVDSGAVADDDVAATEMAAELIPLFAGWNGRTQDQVIDGKKKRVRISSQSDSAQRFAALEAAKEMWSEGMLEAKRLKAEQKERRDKMRAEGEADIAKASKLKTRDEQDVFSEKRRSIAGKISLNIMNIDGFFRWHLGENSSIYRWISDSERKAANAYDDSVRSIAKSVDDWFTARAGSRFAGEKLRFKMAKDRVTITPEKGEVKQMTQLQMITAKLIWRQDDGKRHMKGRKDENGNIVSDWSYGDKFMQQIDDAMSDEAIALFDFLSDAYAAEYESINKVYRKLFGINLPKHLFYAPLTMITETVKDSGSDPVTGFFSGGLSGISGALKSRGTSITEPAFKDALQTYVSHSMQMEHFKAFAELAREAKAIFGRKSFRDQIKRASGEEGVTILNGLLEQLDKGGIRSAEINLETTRILEGLIGRLSTMILFGKLGTVALNITQTAAAAAEMGPRRYLVQLSKLLFRPSNWAEAFKSEFIQRRIAEMPAIVRQVQDSQKRLGPSRLADINDKLGYGISTTDGFFTAATYAMVYDLKKQEAKKLGIPADQIEAFAKNEAERITERLAQPTRKGAKSIYENNLGAQGRAAVNFISESRKNMALIAYAFAKNPSKLPGTAMYVILNAMIASVIRAAWQDFREDDEDEDEAIYNPYKLALEMALDPVYGIPVVGGMLQDLIKASFGFKTFGGTLLESGENAIPAARRMIAFDYDPEEIDRAVSDTNAILGLLGIFDRRLASITAITNVVEDVAKVYDNLTQD